MIILLGPDGSGKSVLTKQMEIESDGMFQAWHAVKETGYKDYMEFLAGEPSKPVPISDPEPFYPGPALQKGAHFVCDRFFWCDYPYSQVVRQEPMMFTGKQFQNLHLLTMAHNPIIILMTRNSGRPDPTIPNEYFSPLLQRYRELLDILDLPYWEWDYLHPPMPVENIMNLSVRMQEHVTWWRNLYKRGIGGVGNTANPRAIVLAEEIGPNNMYRIPFETGPTGAFLTEMIEECETPLSEMYLTNWRKTPSLQENIALFEKEIASTGAEYIIAMGKTAAEGIAHLSSDTVRSLKQGFTMPHPGWIVNHSPTIREMEKRKRGFQDSWRDAWAVVLGGTQESNLLPESDGLVVVE